MLLVDCQCLKKQPSDFVHQWKTFCDETTFTLINKYCKGPAIQIATVFPPVWLVVCLRVLWNAAFKTFISPYFSELVLPESHHLWGSSFFGKCLKFNIDFKNARKNWKKVFCFWDNCIWIVCVKLSLLSR